MNKADQATPLAKPQSPPAWATSVLRLGIDSLIKSATQLPIEPCGALLEALSAYQDAKAFSLQRKLYLFLMEAETISDYIREERVEWLEDQNEEGLGRHITLILERADDERKAEVYGQLYCALIRQNLTREQFNRLCANVDRSFYEDLRHLAKFKEKVLATGEIQPVAESLQGAGLVSPAGVDSGSFNEDGSDDGGNYYQLNHFGRLLISNTSVCHQDEGIVDSE